MINKVNSSRRFAVPDISSKTHNSGLRRYSRSSSFKMAVLFTMLLGLSGGLLGYFLHDIGFQAFTEETEAVIDAEFSEINLLRQLQPEQDLTTIVTNRANHAQFPLYYLEDAKGRHLGGNIPAIPDNVTRLKEGVIKFTWNVGKTEHYIAAKIMTMPDGSRLLIGRDTLAMMERFNRLRTYIVVVLVCMFVVVAVSFFLSLFVVRRINLISTTAQHIIRTGDISKRISINTNWDDLSNLAQTLNELLERVEFLMEDVRRVGDNIAHDLRTPLTRLRQHLEHAAYDGNIDHINAERLMAEADHILSTFQSLLRISNIEKGKRQHSCEHVDIAAILHDVAELYEAVAEDRSIILRSDIAEGLATIYADRDLLFQLFANLLDNAIKFSPKDASVHVELSQKDDLLCVVIADHGPGIPETERSRVFDRFYRTDQSRNTEGTGLGLSLVQAIVEFHSASITLQDNNPGLHVELLFPIR